MGSGSIILILIERCGVAQNVTFSMNMSVIGHLGAVLNFAASTVNAGAWMHNIRLKWLWCIKEEPVLWRRYFRE